ncbi:MAG TPA: TMEM165/GDT1 family protein [Mycobacterium sp.]|jgi:putative Ca2+/H+ antiporter (TMEM165/GDT1 family)
MLTATLISLGVVFVAELGDKSQLITKRLAATGGGPLR